MLPWRSGREICGKCRESDEIVNRLFSWIFSSTAHTKSSLTTDSQLLHRSSCTFSCPSLKCLTHLLTVESLMECSYTSQSWRWLSAGFMFLVFKKKITDCISHVVGFSIFFNILNTQEDVLTLFDCLQIASVSSKRTNKLCTHVHHSDCSTAVAIFANGTYSVDMPYNSKAYYHVHNSQSLDSILSQLIHSASSHLVSIRSILILHSYIYLCLPSCLSSSGF
jgi:hypothetical protein